MKKLRYLILLILVTIITLPVKSSNSEDFPASSSLFFNPSLGYTHSLSGMNSSEITDNLIDYSDNSWYLKLFSLVYFLPFDLGISFSFSGNSSFSKHSRADKLETEVLSRLSDEYVIVSSTGIRDKSYTLLGGEFQKIQFGFAYKVEKGNFMIIPYLHGGVILYDRNIGNIDLINTENEDITSNFLFLSDEKSGLMNFISPAFSFAYRLSEKYHLSFDAAYTYSVFDFNYSEIITYNINNISIEVVENISYQGNVQNITFGLGLIMEIGK